MSDTNVESGLVPTQKRKRGRPPKNQTRAAEAVRPTRVPVSGHRDLLTVLGKDPDFEYRFVSDVNEMGNRIVRFQEGGWEFAPSDNLRIGQAMVYKTSDLGSIVRVPEGQRGDGYMYLMRIKKEWYDEDQVAKQDQIDVVEADMRRERDPDNPADDGMYGEISLKRDRVR